MVGYRAWQLADEAARRAIPPAPADPLPGEAAQWWMLAGPGWAHAVRLLVPRAHGGRRPRSDQFDLEIDSAVVLQRVGITAIHDHLRQNYLPQQMTRQQRSQADAIDCCGAERWTARDELDAATTQDTT